MTWASLISIFIAKIASDILFQLQLTWRVNGVFALNLDLLDLLCENYYYY